MKILTPVRQSLDNSCRLGAALRCGDPDPLILARLTSLVRERFVMGYYLPQHPKSAQVT